MYLFLLGIISKLLLQIIITHTLKLYLDPVATFKKTTSGSQFSP